MPIPLTTTILNPIAPSDVTAVGATHFDIYGSGGYRSITTSGAGSLNDQLNAQVSEQRRRVGMLVYDTRVDTYYRLTQVAPGTWAEENFGGSGSVTSVGMSVPSGLNVSPLTITGDGIFAVEIDTSVLTGGIVKSVGGALAPAVAGQDYAAPSHSHPISAINAGVESGKLLGRVSVGSGGVEQITIGTGVNLSAAGELTATGLGGTVTSVTGQAPISVATPDSKTYVVSHATYANVAGTYGSSGDVPIFTVNTSGHITSVAATPIAGFLPLSGGTLTGSISGVAASFGDLTLSGNLTVNGEQTIVNSNTVQVVDKNIELAINATNDSEANAGGITLHGLQDKSFRWLQATDAWTSSEHLELANGKAFRIDGEQVMSKTALGTTVVGSSLTSVGTLTGGTWQANEIGLAYGGTGANLSSAVTGTIFKKGASNVLVAAVAGDDYLSPSSVIDGGTY